jgi:SET domain-containing protein
MFVNDSTYAVDIGDSASIIGVPTFTDDSNYLGHLINDSAYIKALGRRERHIGRAAHKHRGAHAAREYVRASSSGANCRFRVVAGDMLIGVEASRDIKAGDELFVSYGVAYWRSNKPP